MRRLPSKAPFSGAFNACLGLLRHWRQHAHQRPSCQLAKAATQGNAQQLGTAYYHAKDGAPVNMATVDNGTLFRVIHRCRNTLVSLERPTASFPGLRLPQRHPTLFGFCAPVRGTAASFQREVRAVNGPAESPVHV